MSNNHNEKKGLSDRILEFKAVNPLEARTILMLILFVPQGHFLFFPFLLMDRISEYTNIVIFLLLYYGVLPLITLVVLMLTHNWNNEELTSRFYIGSIVALVLFAMPFIYDAIAMMRPAIRMDFLFGILFLFMVLPVVLITGLEIAVLTRNLDEQLDPTYQEIDKKKMDYQSKESAINETPTSLRIIQILAILTPLLFYGDLIISFLYYCLLLISILLVMQLANFFKLKYQEILSLSFSILGILLFVSIFFYDLIYVWIDTQIEHYFALYVAIAIPAAMATGLGKSKQKSKLSKTII